MEGNIEQWITLVQLFYQTKGHRSSCELEECT